MKHINSLINDLADCVRKLIDQLFPEKKNNTEKDAARTVMASSLLQLSEFSFFELAYSRWYGRDLPESRMEPFFSDYIMRNEMPIWVRHLSREVQSHYYNGTLDPYKYNAEYAFPSHEIGGPIEFLPVFLTLAYLVFYLMLSGQIFCIR